MSSLAHGNDSSTSSGTKVYNKEGVPESRAQKLVDRKGSRLSTLSISKIPCVVTRRSRFLANSEAFCVLKNKSILNFER